MVRRLVIVSDCEAAIAVVQGSSSYVPVLAKDCRKLSASFASISMYQCGGHDHTGSSQLVLTLGVWSRNFVPGTRWQTERPGRRCAAASMDPSGKPGTSRRSRPMIGKSQRLLAYSEPPRSTKLMWVPCGNQPLGAKVSAQHVRLGHQCILPYGSKPRSPSIVKQKTSSSGPAEAQY